MYISFMSSQIKFCVLITTSGAVFIKQFLLNKNHEPLSHINISQVAVQLNCGATCRIRMWYLTNNQLFYNSEKSGKYATRGIVLTAGPLWLYR